MMVIGITGKKRSGKDAVCALIKEVLCSYDVQRFAFADPLKQELAKACRVSVADIEREKSRYRLGLQWWGTEFRRAVDDDYWIDQTRYRLQQFFKPAKLRGNRIAVITDARFVNEAHFVRLDRGGGRMGTLLRVVRGTRWQRFWARVNDAVLGRQEHASEAGVPDGLVDYTIVNDGTLADLREKVIEFLEWWQQAGLGYTPIKEPIEISVASASVARFRAALNQLVLQVK